MNFEFDCFRSSSIAFTLLCELLVVTIKANDEISNEVGGVTWGEIWNILIKFVTVQWIFNVIEHRAPVLRLTVSIEMFL